MIGTTAAILGAAAIGAGSSALAAKSANKSVSNATTAETASNNQALDLQNRQLDLQKQQYDQQRADYAPWRDVGVGALQQLARTFNIKAPTSTYGAPAPAAAPVPTYSGQPAQNGGAAINPGFGYDSSGNFSGDPNAMGPGAVGGISPDFYPQAAITNSQFGVTTAQPEPAAQASPVSTPTTGGAQGQFGDFFASPGYQFRVNQGLTAITGNRAARGLIDSGSLGKGLINYGQQAGSQEFGSWFDKLSTLAGFGKSATDGSVAAGQNNVNAQGIIANNQAGIVTDQGKNLSSSYLTKGGTNAGLINGVGSALGGIIQNYPRANTGSNYDYTTTGVY